MCLDCFFIKNGDFISVKCITVGFAKKSPNSLEVIKNIVKI